MKFATTLVCTRSLLFAFTLTLVSVGDNVRAATIGEPPIARPTFDGGTGQLFVYAGVFPVSGETVVSWNFFADGTAQNSCSTGMASYVCFPGTTITPVILTRIDVNTFEVTGVGTTRPNSLTGLQTFAFDLVAGSAVVGPNSTFGFRSGGPLDSGDFDFGVVQFDSSSSTGFQYVGERVPVIVGDSYTAGAPSRTYSITFTTAPVPEPGLTLPVITVLTLLGLRGKQLVSIQRLRQFGRRVEGQGI